ncbi:MAG: carboxypeptidase regulatory-like domain-containing protein [Candidatus Kapaibacterium sp.]
MVCLATSLGALAIPKNQSATAKVPAGGSINGTVRFTGPIPKQARADAAAFGMCGKTHSYDRLEIGKDHGVEYTLVYVANPPAGRANFPAVTISQKDCGYSPHMAIATRGSSVTFLNDDAGLHNVHGYYTSGSERSTLFNFAQPTQGERTAQQLRKAGMVNVQCDVHSWMNAWIWVTDNPYVAVTKADGSYSIEGLPPGTYNLVMWHEGWKMEPSNGGRPEFSGAVVEQKQVTVTDGGSATADFELK